MPQFLISSLDDPRVAVYRNLKDKELDRAGQLFIAEGEYIVRRLLESDYPIESVFIATKFLSEISPLVPVGVPVYVAPPEVMLEVFGMRFHSGAFACGRRKPWRPMEDVVPSKPGPLTLVICPDISNVQNVGTIIRISTAFGVDAIILGEQCHDPFWRQSVRVSMGTVFKMPLYQSRDLVADMSRLRERWGVEIAATVLAEDAQPLADARRPDRFAIVFGNEAQGIGRPYREACDREITIPMKLGTDSLNVAIAAGIFLYHFTREDSFAMKDA